MSERLPLFPLGTVLFPGLVLPLHVFEERYRELVRHLVREGTERKTFGVVAIERGWEVDTSAAGPAGYVGTSATLHEVGCSAEIRQLTEHTDGRFDLVTVGQRRFRIREVHADDAPFLIADVEWIDRTADDDKSVPDPDAAPDAAPEPDPDPAAELLVPGLLDVFQRYLELIRTDGLAGAEQLPDDPTVLSYLIAATAVLTLDERQRLLAEPTTVERLRLERRLLSREMGLLRQVRALPMPLGDLAATPSPN